MEEIDLKLAEAIAGQALADNVKHVQKQKFLERIIICLTIIICTGMVCGTFALISIAQQAINAEVQKNQALIDYVSGAEIITEIIDSGDGNAVKIEGDNNNAVGGNHNG